MVLARTIPAVGLAIALVSLPLNAETFGTSDQNPFLTGYGLTTPWSARIGPARSQSLEITYNWSSTAVIQKSDTEGLINDSEAREWRIDWQYAISDRAAIRMKLPYRAQDGGSLDSFIDSWHHAFGMPEGARPFLPHDQYRIQYARNGVLQLSELQGHSGLGNAQIEGGYQLYAGDHSATSIWMNAKLPTATGQPIGSDAFDIGSGIASEYNISRRWSVFGQAAFIHLGRGQTLPDQQREWMTQAFINLDFLASNALTLNVQFEVHSEVFADTTLNQLSETWLMTAGGSYRFNQHWRAQFGLGEDIKVESSPDVNFFFSVARTWR